MPKIAIVAALEREVRPLVRDWRVTRKEQAGRNFTFFESGSIVLVCGGIGAEPARRAAEAVISLHDPEIVYSVGFAGALDPTLKVGDMIRPSKVINANDGSSVAIDGGSGALVSFASVANPQQKAKLWDSFAAQAVDMEAAAVARAAEARGKAFAAIKVISDASDFELPPTDQFVSADGTFSEARFALFAALRPWIWPQVFRLATNSKRASHALCTALRQMIST